MTPTKIISALTLALLMTAGVASAQVTTIAPSSATTVNTTGTTMTHVNAAIENGAFNPHNIVVSPGSTVVWTNGDSVAHTIVADKGGFSSGSIPSGGTYSQLFNEPGTYLYHDSVNGSAGGQGMFGIVVVLPYGSTNPNSGTSGTGTGTGATNTGGTNSSCTNCTSPGVPNTGSGGNAAANALMLTLSGAVLLGGALVLRKRLS